jgi:hypothetical protein
LNLSDETLPSTGSKGRFSPAVPTTKATKKHKSLPANPESSRFVQVLPCQFLSNILQ